LRLDIILVNYNAYILYSRSKDYILHQILLSIYYTLEERYMGYL